MKHVNKWLLALSVCMNSIFKCFIGKRVEWSHIEWHYFPNWQVLLIQTSARYCLPGSIYSPVKMYVRVGKGTVVFLATYILGCRCGHLSVHFVSFLHLPVSPPSRRGRVWKHQWRKSNIMVIGCAWLLSPAQHWLWAWGHRRGSRGREAKAQGPPNGGVLFFPRFLLSSSNGSS